MIPFLQMLANRYYGLRSILRIRAYRLIFPIGVNTILLDGFQVRNPQGLSIGKNTFINVNFFVQSSGRVKIGDDVIIGPNVSIYSENHNFLNKKKKIIDQGFIRNAVVIGNDVWIGTNVVILPGVVIEDGCVIGAGSVVTKSFSKYSVIAGVPAKKIKSRK